MNFSIDEKLIPPELTSTEKGRLQNALKQFATENNLSKNYTDFFSTKIYNYFLQGDVVSDIRFPVFDIVSGSYYKKYYDCLLISNTCDMDGNNMRIVEKNVVVSRLIPLSDYLLVLEKRNVNDLKKIILDIKNQQYSNILYLPPNKHNIEYIAFLDDLHFISLNEIQQLKIEISENRISSLGFYGYYLFIFKLSYHLLRLPEVTHR